MILSVIRDWEIAVADIGNRLKIKYGLARDPSAEVIERWRQRTNALIRQGVAPEAAGRQAAQLIFPDFKTHFYASEADTISYLLDQLGGGK
ncbi:hypothetical protein [uncultured Mameliella sp.]|uniref:hypothetical protein n=1 Tax=uncultured Mameliella sp. TaxID=1447087 RepID=UPI002602A6C0|nr:hypothetical protein [uncultured Mameliella sp.]